MVTLQVSAVSSKCQRDAEGGGPSVPGDSGDTLLYITDKMSEWNMVDEMLDGMDLK